MFHNLIVMLHENMLLLKKNRTHFLYDVLRAESYWIFI